MISSIRYSGRKRNPSGVSSGSGSLSTPRVSEEPRHQRRRNEPNLDLRVLLFRVDHSHEPCHDKVDEADAARKVLGVEQLDFVRVELAVVELALLLQAPRYISVAPDAQKCQTNFVPVDVSLRGCLVRRLGSRASVPVEESCGRAKTVPLATSCPPPCRRSAASCDQAAARSPCAP